MATLYLSEPGTALQKDGERLVVTRDERVVEAIPLLKVDQVVVMGRGVRVTTPALFALASRGIDVVYLAGKSGRFVARMRGQETGFGRLRFEQALLVADTARSLALARELVRGKLHNQRVLVLRHGGSEAWAQAAAEGIARMMERIDGAGDADVLRGLEGQAAALYFGAYRRLLRQDLGFARRAYYPPPDPVNALLSFGYTLLLQRILGAVGIVGLDPYLGVFHVLDYGRPSLALDLEEEFRPIVVDSLVLDLVNHRVLTAGDFRPVKDKGVLLGDAGRARFLTAFERRLAATLVYPPSGETTTYLRCLELQTRQAARCILGQQARYQPLLVR
ncbi:MAG TPA: CRISPR-associated endonuclease Cas1 [Anaerolineae bacterium]|nr:CRISPR-associated endonuclease Cas1 [Anaerolineae bacterium]HOR00992.1 CRISPR-associated endonuclease Cas1 [Anaerolineae bacterium]HPL30541.1 CRISPR-associated endonuclease Cas1 [Anaerolineae bacterium]